MSQDLYNQAPQGAVSDEFWGSDQGFRGERGASFASRKGPADLP